MLRSAVHAEEEEDRKDVFAPVADLMVGVVFIFIMLLIAMSLDLADEQTVPLSQYQTLVSENETLRRSNDGLKAENEQLKKLLQAEQQKTRQLSLDLDAERNRANKLADFVRFIKDSNVVPLMDRLSRADETRSKLLEDVRQRLSQTGVEVTIDPSNGTLRLPSGRLFDSGRADPTARGRQTIQSLGTVLAEMLPCYGSNVVKPLNCPTLPSFTALSAVYIEGHTDAAPIVRAINQFRDNWDLSAGRAIEAFKLLRETNETLRDIKNLEGDPLLGVSGYAETRPVDRKAANRLTDEAKEQDRRIEVRITMATDRRAVGAVLTELTSRLGGIDALVR